MIRKLRKKFMIAAVAAVFLVLLVLIGTINILNYRSLVSDADGTLQILSSNHGAFPRQMFREQDRLPDTPPPEPEENRENMLRGKRGGYGELAYQSRYFAVWFAADGSVYGFSAAA